MSGGATGGVQNYKGVMLCNRPQDDSPPVVSPATNPRFKPGGLAAEPIGINPAKENLVSNMQAVEAEAARRRAEDPERLAPDTVLTKHKRWLAEMARKKMALNAELADQAVAAASKQKVFESYSKTLRQAVRERSAELDATGTTARRNGRRRRCLSWPWPGHGADCSGLSCPGYGAAPPTNSRYTGVVGAAPVQPGARWCP